VSFEARGGQAFVRVSLGPAAASAQARRVSSSGRPLRAGWAGGRSAGASGGLAGGVPAWRSAGGASAGSAGGVSGGRSAGGVAVGRSAGGRAAGGVPARPGLVPALQLALARAAQLLGRVVPITSGYRSPADQARLWAHRAENPYPVAAPGTSAHERGIAVDVPLAFVPELARVAAQVGLCHPYPVADPVHFELCQ
jgi:hypothetical protein